MSKKYLLYARVSPKGSTWSAAETSIPNQFEMMRDEIRRRDPGADFIEIYDEFKSGKNLERPGIQQILADLAAPTIPWDGLVVWNIDRLSRSLIDALPILKLLRDRGREFIAVNQPHLNATGAMGKFLIEQTIAFAELERGMTSERVSAKMGYIASQGKVPWGHVPLGYRRAAGQKNVVEVDPEGAELVRRIFADYLAGHLSWARLNEEFPGKIADRPVIYRALRNPFYLGEIHYKGQIYKGEHPALITREDFDQVQALLASKRRNYQRHGVQKYDYLLSGLLKCHCGRCMTGYSVHAPAGKYYYYKCTAPGCGNAVSAPALDQAVLDELTATYTDPATIEAALAELREHQQRENLAHQTEAAKLREELAAAQREQEKVAELFLSGVVTKENAEFFNARLSTAREKVAETKKSLSALELGEIKTDITAHLPELVKAGAEWAEQIKSGSADLPTKRNLIMSAINGITCTSRTPNEINFDLELIMRSSKKWWAKCNIVIIRSLVLRCGKKTTKCCLK